jgi:hypothetical protein
MPMVSARLSVRRPDEEVFEAPEGFRVDRSPIRRLAFGYGEPRLAAANLVGGPERPPIRHRMN